MQLLAVLSTFVLSVLAFDNSRFDNLAVYWGQNSYGAVHSDQANFQKSLAFYCQDDSIDVFPLAFLNVFFGTGGKPSINLANTCNSVDNATFPGTNLPNCASLASDIKTCQSKGKIVTLSLGGATGSVGFGSDSQAETFAQTIWDLFFGGSSDTRPFGDAILDGVDLDIEGGGSSGYAAFLTKLRSLASGLNKKLYVTAAPQCVFPDAALSGVLNAVAFDAVYVQFYNNPCGLTHFSEAANWDFGLWDDWARHTSPNPNVKIYVGAPADPTAAGSGYVPPATLATIAKQMRTSFPSFGGVMLWDASQAFANNRYDLAIKNAMKAAGGTGFTFPACSAPAFVAGNNYAGGSTVSFGGYIWQSKWFSNAQPSNSPFGDWSAISACAGSGGGNGGGTSTTSTTAPSGTPASGNCAGVAAWSSSTVYATPGTKVTFNGRLYSSNWWTQNDLPTGQSGAWTDQGACSSSRQRNSRFFRL